MTAYAVLFFYGGGIALLAVACALGWALVSKVLPLHQRMLEREKEQIETGIELDRLVREGIQVADGLVRLQNMFSRELAVAQLANLNRYD